MTKKKSNKNSRGNIKDAAEKQLLKFADVYADIVNVLLFNGEQRVQPDDLEDYEPHSVYNTNQGILEVERDVPKLWKKNGTIFCCFNIENQTVSDSYMAIRTNKYDALAYDVQYQHCLDVKKENAKLRKEYKRQCSILREHGASEEEVNSIPEPEYQTVPKIHPVYTFVLYYGSRHWNSNKRDLYSCLIDNFSPEDMPFITNFRAKIFEIAFLDDETISKFQSDFKFVALLCREIRLAQQEKRPIECPQEWFKHSNEVFNLITAFTGDQDLLLDAYEWNMTSNGGNKMRVKKEYWISTGIKKKLMEDREFQEEMKQKFKQDESFRSECANELIPDLEKKMEEKYKQNEFEKRVKFVQDVMPQLSYNEAVRMVQEKFCDE